METSFEVLYAQRSTGAFKEWNTRREDSHKGTKTQRKRRKDEGQDKQDEERREDSH
jgi:hypothetical protein